MRTRSARSWSARLAGSANREQHSNARAGAAPARAFHVLLAPMTLDVEPAIAIVRPAAFYPATASVGTLPASGHPGVAAARVGPVASQPDVVRAGALDDDFPARTRRPFANIDAVARRRSARACNEGRGREREPQDSDFPALEHVFLRMDDLP